jgi:hypothetical protein
MLTSRIQRQVTPRLSPAALEAAATAFLAEAEGKKASTIRNRGWRSVIQQGRSYEGLTYLGTNPQTLEDNGIDLGIVGGNAFRTADDRPAPGNPARAFDCNFWNAIRILAPTDLRDMDVLTLSSQTKFGGRGQARAIGKAIGLSDRMVRKIQDRHAAWAAENLDPAALVAALDADLPPNDMVVPRRVPSRRGRKARGAPPRPPRFLVLAPHTPAPSRAPRPYRPRVRRPRFVDPRQMNFLGFEEAA